MNHPGPRRVRPLCLLVAGMLAACGSGGGDSAGAGVDSTPPTPDTVADGFGADVDVQTSTTTIAATWSGFHDDSGTVASYAWAIGTTVGGTQVQGWQPVGNVQQAQNANLALATGIAYFVAVRAYDTAGNVSVPAVSDGVTVQPSGAGGGGTGSATLASSVGQWGITWRFDQPMPVGRFCNGDWWVIGPVSIVEFSPPSQIVGSRVINGAMVNPTPDGYHGYDTDLFAPYENRYVPSLNVAAGVSESAPLQLAPGTSLISVISQMEPASNGSLSQLETAAVLTVLDAEPPADAFRPPYTGNDKTIRYREADLDYDALARVAPAGTVPDFVDTAQRCQRVWLDHTPGWVSRFMHPVDNMPDYSRDFCALYGTGCLLLQLDVPDAQKRDLLVELTQIGIDFWGNVDNGCYWEGVGGQGSGRKFPILFAGAVLGDATLLNVGTSHPSAYYGPGNASNSSHFGEDCQTFYVAETSPGVYNWGFGGYAATHAGLPEWGNSHTTWPSNDNSSWSHDPYRRCCTANAWVGQTLAARFMGLVAAWNHPSYFDYMDRYVQTESPGQWTRSWNPWHEQMWDAYRASL